MATRLAQAWAARVAANREQAERLREAPDGGDHYRPIARAFRADPHRTDDPALDELLDIAQANDVWVDVGAGAGRFALPLALHLPRVIAVEPSAGMRRELAAAQIEHGIANLDVLDQRWPSDDPALTDIATVALISHVAYDIEAIDLFLDTLQRAATRECVALLYDRSPGSVFWQLWPAVHGEAQIHLPGATEFIELLQARGAAVETSEIARPPTGQRFIFDTVDDAVSWARRRLWLSEDSTKLLALREAATQLLIPTHGGWTLPDQPVQLLIRWRTR